MKYRKKPVVVDAVQVRWVDFNPALSPFEKMFDGAPFSGGSNHDAAWIADAINRGDLAPHNTGSVDCAHWHVKTLEGLLNAKPDDWVVRGIEGELYPVADHIFRQTYEPVEE